MAFNSFPIPTTLLNAAAIANAEANALAAAASQSAAASSAIQADDAATAAAASAAGIPAAGLLGIVINSRAEALLSNIPPGTGSIIVRQGDLMLFYQRDPSGTALETADGATWSPLGDVYPDHWGENTSPGVTDMIAAINSALTWASTRGKVVNLADQDYLHSSTITFPAVTGLRLVGRGANRSTGLASPTILSARFTSGPQVRLNQNCQELSGMVIRARYERVTADYSATTPGVLAEYYQDAADVGLGSPKLEDVLIAAQAGDALQTSGDVFSLRAIGFTARDCKGRPLNVDDGTITGRTNKGRAGGWIIEQFHHYNCAAPVKIGNRGTYGAYRITIIDGDWTFVTQNDATLNPEQVVADIHGENITLMGVAFGGRISGTPALKGIHLSGRHIRLSSCRWVGLTGLGKLTADTEIGCDDITVEHPAVTGDSTANPAFVIDGAVGNVVVMAPIQSGAGQLNITNWFTAGYVNGVLLTSSILNLYGKQVAATIGTFSGAVADAVRVTRDAAVAGITVTRTGSGAGVAAIKVESGFVKLGSESDMSVVLKRNNVDRMTVKSNTINIASLPTSSSGLSSGDLWNDSGTLKVV